MRNWKEEDYQPGATIPIGGTARNNKTGSWRATSIPHFKKWICQECLTPKRDCRNFCEGCSDACHRDCLLCWISCPEDCIIIKEGQIEGIDFDYCKGCGICASVCPRGAITMERVNIG